MSRLFLMRHAQAGHGATDDERRPLTDHGRAQAALVGRQLADLAPIDLVLCSSSTRTRQTLDELHLAARVEFQQALYLAGTDQLRQRIAETDEGVGSLLVIAHNSGIGLLAAELTQPVDAEAADRLGWSFPTAAVHWFDLDGPWSDLAEGTERVRGTGALPR